MTVREPTPATLRKYGLSLDQWRQMLQEQGGVCAICRKVPKSGRLVVDHEHCRGWKGMRPEQKRKQVRGLLCFMPCNRFLVAKNNGQTAELVLSYLNRYQNRR